MAFAGVMNELTFFADQRRNKNFEQTHRQLIERAVELIGEGSCDSLSVATLAREAGMNRSTVYYHFESREALMAEVKLWVGRQLGEILLGYGDQVLRVERAILFVLGHSGVVHLWVRDLVESGAITKHFPSWDALVGKVENGFLNPRGGVQRGATEVGEGELWSTVLLAIAVAAPRLYQFAVRPDEDHHKIARRFAKAYGRLRGALRETAL